MSKKAYRTTAAQARVTHWPQSQQAHHSTSSLVESRNHSVIYTGRVDYTPSESDIDGHAHKSVIDLDEHQTDCKSIQELKSDELDTNLTKLQETDMLQALTLLDTISSLKKHVYWKQAGKKRTFRYNGHFKCTQHCWGKKAQRERGSGVREKHYEYEFQLREKTC